MAELFQDPIYGKRARNPGSMDRSRGSVLAAYHNARKLPQAVIKPAGHIHTGSYLQDRIDYLTRDGKLTGNDRGFLEKSAEEIKKMGREWADDEKGRAGNRIAMHLILSSPKGTDVEKLKNAVKSFQNKSFGDHDSFFVIHTDTDYPHAHLVVRTRNFYGKKMQSQKGDFHQWRQDYAAELRAYGIEVAATNRASRGVTKKYRNRMADRAIKDRGEPFKFDPEKDLKATDDETNQKYAKHYKSISAELIKSKDPNAQRMGASIRQFASEMAMVKNKSKNKDKGNENELER